MIIPTSSGGDRIGALLDSLSPGRSDVEVIVVDNASADGTREVLARYPDVTALRMEENLGFGRAVNHAAREASGSSLVLVNDDCVCDPGFVEAISAALDPARGVVMAASVLRQDADETLIDTAGMELDATLLVFDYLNGEPVSVVDAGVEDPIGPSAAAAAFDRGAFLDAGGFDEALFAYWEDVDLVLRLRLAGGRCALAAAAGGTHRHSATLGPGSALKNELIGFGRGYLLRKWGVMSPSRAARVLVRDGVLVGGQALIDRTLAGAAGRRRGWRAAAGAERRPYPATVLGGYPAPGALATLRRRLRRRREIRRRFRGRAAS